jgi:23S rRNA (uracil1939-C5)-methyltransferase
VAQVTGVEGDAGLIDRAHANAERNHLTNVDFHVNDLTADLVGTQWTGQKYDKILLDPPRSGALEMLGLITGLDASRIVYVSCHPASLARDAGELVNRFGYTLVSAGVMDMFPHTAHVESIALFEKK